MQWWTRQREENIVLEIHDASRGLPVVVRAWRSEYDRSSRRLGASVTAARRANVYVSSQLTGARNHLVLPENGSFLEKNPVTVALKCDFKQNGSRSVFLLLFDFKTCFESQNSSAIASTSLAMLVRVVARYPPGEHSRRAPGSTISQSEPWHCSNEPRFLGSVNLRLPERNLELQMKKMSQSWDDSDVQDEENEVVPGRFWRPGDLKREVKNAPFLPENGSFYPKRGRFARKEAVLPENADHCYSDRVFFVKMPRFARKKGLFSIFSLFSYFFTKTVLFSSSRWVPGRTIKHRI